MSLFKWSRTAENNATIDSTITAREGQAPSTVNNAMRGIMAAVAKFRDDISPNTTTGGSSTAYTLTTYQAFSALTTGLMIGFVPHATSGTPATINVDSLGAKPLRTATGVAIATGVLAAGSPYLAVYNLAADEWRVMGAAVSNITASNGTVTSTGAAIAATGAIYGGPKGAGGRITLTSGSPVLAATVAAATTIYYTPYGHNLIPIFDGTVVRSATFAEMSIALGASWAANTNFDVFLGNDAGTLRLCTVAWTNDTTRATALNLTQNGFYSNDAAFTARYNNTTTFTCPQYQGTYLGTIRTNASTGTVDYILGGTAAGGTAAVIGLWNMYNRVVVSPLVQDSTGSWTYNSTTIRNMNASAAQRISFVRGLNDDGVFASLFVNFNGGASGDYFLGIGLDATALTYAAYGSFGANNAPGSVAYSGNPGFGFHYLQACERQATTASAATAFGVISTHQTHRFAAQMRA